jgi:hypothetical protein
MIGMFTRSLRVCAALVLLVPALWVTPHLRAQRVRVSPHEVHEFDVDGCHITFNYGRPSTRGRVIWGALVPWGRWWMPGADETTIISTDCTLVFGDVTMPAGQHTLYMLPDRKAPKFIVNKEVGQFHTQYHPDRDLGRVDYTMRMLTDPADPTSTAKNVEQLTYGATAREGGGGLLTLTWADREYSVAFVVKK